MVLNSDGVHENVYEYRAVSANISAAVNAGPWLILCYSKSEIETRTVVEGGGRGNGTMCDAPSQKVNFSNTNWSNCIDAPSTEVWMAFFWKFFFAIAVAIYLWLCGVCGCVLTPTRKYT